jgi:hypothetical protein
MKTKITFLFLFLLVNFSYASFPVQRVNLNNTTSEISNEEKSEDFFVAASSSEKSKGIALILALTLGLLAAHRWYVGTFWGFNVLFIMSFGGLGIWLLIDIIRILVGTFNPKGRFKKSFF